MLHSDSKHKRGNKYLVPKRQIKELKWIPHIGEDFLKEHFREPPPGRRHAVCDEDLCEVHEDHVNPLEDPIGHLIYDAPHIASSLILGGLAFF